MRKPLFVPELPHFTREQENVLRTAGALLLAIQTTERIIEMCFTHILQLDGPLTLELLERQRQKRRTLGQVLKAMRSHIEIADEFDAALTEFLEKRNIFAHRLADVPDWALDTNIGIVAANKFLARLWQLNEVVLDVFCGLARAWSKQNPDFPGFPGAVGFGAGWQWHVEKIFFAKEKPPQSN